MENCYKRKTWKRTDFKWSSSISRNQRIVPVSIHNFSILGKGIEISLIFLLVSLAFSISSIFIFDFFSSHYKKNPYVVKSFGNFHIFCVFKRHTKLTRHSFAFTLIIACNFTSFQLLFLISTFFFIYKWR